MAKHLSIKDSALAVIKQMGSKEKAIEAINDAIYELASFTWEGEIVKSANGSAHQLKHWASVLIYLNEKHKP